MRSAQSVSCSTGSHESLTLPSPHQVVCAAANSLAIQQLLDPVLLILEIGELESEGVHLKQPRSCPRDRRCENSTIFCFFLSCQVRITSCCRSSGMVDARRLAAATADRRCCALLVAGGRVAAGPGCPSVQTSAFHACRRLPAHRSKLDGRRGHAFGPGLSQYWLGPAC